MVARSNPIFAEAPTAMWTVAIIGTFTAIFAAAIALTQNDIKKVLAYSTVSQLAYMFLALGIGAWVAAIFHLVSHGFFKGLLFMGSGSVIHGANGEQDMRLMGNLRAKMRWTYWTMVVGSLALAGIPIFAGFFSKDEILAEAFNRGYLVFYAVGIIVAFMTAFYTFRMIFMTFWGEWRGPADAWHHVHESAMTMVAPLAILAVPTALFGLLLGIPPEGGLIHGWLEDVFHHAEEAHAGVLPGSIAAEGHHGFELFGVGGLLLLVGATIALAGVWMAYRWYVQRPGTADRFVERIPLGLGPGMYRASVNKYYVDDIYQLVFARGGVLFSNALWWFDAKVIDGAVNGAGRVASGIGSGLRKIQTGRVQNYGLGMAAGLALILLVYATVLR
jgi:NADH-quinone oxidoreductase subunit L